MEHVEVYIRSKNETGSLLLVKNKTRGWWFSLEGESCLPLHESGWNFGEGFMSDKELLIPHTLLIWT